ncbi:MAG: hypothetical protein MMC33_001318 [Icmadophila ericetorum]|nr:hypothetical protein [Icmadophila ericetorum]
MTPTRRRREEGDEKEDKKIDGEDDVISDVEEKEEDYDWDHDISLDSESCSIFFCDDKFLIRANQRTYTVYSFDLHIDLQGEGQGYKRARPKLVKQFRQRILQKKFGIWPY